jgi:uncharacterized lipoprotein YbaY
MRFLFAPMLCSALFLVACDKNQESPTPETSAKSEVPMIRGTIMMDAPVTLGAGAELNVRLLDTTRVDSEPTLVTQKSMPVTQLPINFELPYVSDMLSSSRRYAVDATILEKGQVHYLSTNRVPVSVRENARPVNIQLVQAMSTVMQDPVAALLADYARLEAQLGGLKRFTDSRIVGAEGNEVAIGWDAFADESGLRMVRETISDAEGNNRHTRKFAYLNGKPWVAIRERGGNSVKLGWNEEGKITVTQRNGQPDASAETEAAELLKLALDAYRIASARVPG